jgi:hypothetical protein
MKKGLIFIITSIVTLGILEIFLQFAEVDSKSLSDIDPKYGATLKKDKSLLLFNEGFYIGGSNEYGYWGNGYSKERIPNTFRIALIGDSYVEGHQVFSRDHFGTLLEEELEQKISKPVEVLNFGMSGFDLSDSYCYYKSFVEDYKPDLILMFVADEDFKKPTNSYKKPIAVLENDSVIVDYSFIESEKFQKRLSTSAYRGKSIVLGFVYKALNIVQSGNWKSIVFGKFVSKPDKKNKMVKLGDLQLQKGIISELVKAPTLFVAKDSLQVKASDLFNDFPEHVVYMDVLKDRNNKFWRTTKKYGHWNVDAHQSISKELSSYIAYTVSKK